MLKQAGAIHWLADPVDFENLPLGLHYRVLDSGAYRAFKSGNPLNLETWLEDLRRFHGRYQWAIMPDTLGDHLETRKAWRRWRDMGLRYEDECGSNSFDVIPVWQWGSKLRDLDWFLGDAPFVCLGGLVPAMRAKDEGVLSELKSICRDYGNQLHFLGLNWLKALEELKPMLLSADTSKWLDGARYGHIIMLDAGGRLRQQHRNNSPEHRGMDREQLCVECAKNMRLFCDVETAEKLTPSTPAKNYCLKPMDFPSRTPTSDAVLRFSSFQFQFDNKKRHGAALARMPQRA